MEKKWLELLKDIAEHKAGTFIEVEANVHRSYIDAGLARDGGKGPDVVILQRAIEAFRGEIKDFVGATATAVQEATRGLATRRPNVAEGVDIGDGTVRPGEQHADRTRSLGDSVIQIVNAIGNPDQVARQAAHDRLIQVYKFTRSMGESTGAGGGYATSTDYEQMILAIEAEDAVMRPGCTEVPLGARQVIWPALDQFVVPAVGQSAIFAGVSVYYKGELRQRQETDAKLRQVTLAAQDLTAFMEFSRDLMADAPSLTAMLPLLVGGAISWREDYEFLIGTGSGRPLGIANAPARITATRATALTVTYPDITFMKSRMYTRGKMRCVFLAHPYHENTFLTLQDPAGHYIYVPYFSGNEGPAQVNPMPRLAGVPVMFSEKLPAPGNEGDFILVDRKAYLAGTRSGLELGLSDQFLYDTDQIALRAKLRHDGQPWMKAPIYLADGSQTNKVSSIITLSTKLS